MHSEISTYITDRITAVNGTISGTDNDILQVSVTLDIDTVPANQSNYRYLLKLDTIEEEEVEAECYMVNGEIEMAFMIPNKDYTKYATIIDSYVMALVRNIKANKDYNVSGFGLEVLKVTAKNLKNADNSSLKPVIEFEARATY